MKFETQNLMVGDILKVTQGDLTHYERIIQLLPEIITVDMNSEKEGETSTQGLSDAAGISYELIPIYKLADMLENWIPKDVAYYIANRFYGSDYYLAHSTFNNALKELDY